MHKQLNQASRKCRWSTEESGTCEELDGLGAMELAMGSWADWVASKVDPLKKRVFFVTMSPTHLWYVPEPSPATFLYPFNLNENLQCC